MERKVAEIKGSQHELSQREKKNNRIYLPGEQANGIIFSRASKP